MSVSLLIDEEFPHKVTAELSSRESAEAVMEEVAEDPELRSARLELVEPGDERLGKKLEPENRGIARSALKSHLVLGLLFLIAGLSIAWLLVTFGPPVTRSNPVEVFIALALVPTLVGMLLAGALTLRPDHDPMIYATRRAADAGYWTVVVHCKDEDQKQRVTHLVNHRTQTL